jgi:hypothetical protein
VKKSTSLGAWNPDSNIVEKATECLRESSGISVPKVATILKLLVGYLIVLVPINWLFFRLLGRVELAWVAAPIIAMLGAVYVAGSVRLDVGFSRSQTSFGFLEVHNEHPRGMLSTFYAFYTSLSTNYEAVYKEGNGLVAPVLRGAMRTGVGEGQSLEYWNADDRGSGLQRFSVLSNSTGMLQSEEMVGLSGALRWSMDSENSKIQLKNDTTIPIRDIGMLGINDQGKLMMSWIGTIEPGQSTAQFVQPRSPSSKLVNMVLPEKGVVSITGSRPRTTQEGRRWFPQWEDNPLLKKPTSIRSTDGLLWTDEPVDDVYMGAMLLVVAERYPLQKGEYIALGWTDANPSGLQISPKSSEQKHKTIVLMHIRAASLGDVQPDTRIFASLNDEDGEVGEN